VTAWPLMTGAGVASLFATIGAAVGGAALGWFGAAIVVITGLVAALARLMRIDSSPSLISISARPDSSSISISFLILRMSMGVPDGSVAQFVDRGSQR